MSHEAVSKFESANPFIYGRPLETADPFFHRGHELAWISYSGQKPRESKPLALVGPPGIGKTSLIKQAMADPGNKELQIIIIDAPSIVEIEVREFLWSFTERLSLELKRIGIAAPELQKRQLLHNAVHEFDTGFWEPLDDSLINQRLLLVLDAADLLFELAESNRLGSEILDIIHQLYLGSAHIEFLYVLFQVDRSNPSARCLFPYDDRILELRNFELEEALYIIDRFHPYWAAKDVRKYIHDLTGGHPNDLQRLCHILYNRCAQLGISHITMADVSAVLAMDPSPDDYYMPVYRRRNVYKYRFPPEG
ncbi:MAG: AAA family ATPase [Candidatus Promineifilaceae bacterium]|jgi:hypothetical protein